MKYVKLARASLEHYVKYKERIKVPDNLSEELLSSRRGAFVTIKRMEC